MMKFFFLVIFVFSIVFLSLSCFAQPEVITKAPSNLTGDALADVLAHIEKGKILFKEKCAKCHGIYTKGKSKIPNFSKQELKDYNIKFIQQDPLNHAVAEKMTDEEIMDVIYFLQFYQRPEPYNTESK